MSIEIPPSPAPPPKRDFAALFAELGKDELARALGVGTHVIRDFHYGDIPLKADELCLLVELYPDFDLDRTVRTLTARRRERGLVRPRKRVGR